MVGMQFSVAHVGNTSFCKLEKKPVDSFGCVTEDWALYICLWMKFNAYFLCKKELKIQLIVTGKTISRNEFFLAGGLSVWPSFFLVISISMMILIVLWAESQIIFKKFYALLHFDCYYLLQSPFLPLLCSGNAIYCRWIITWYFMRRMSK